MTAAQQSDVLHLLAQRLSIKEVACWVGVSEWEVVALVGRGR